MYITEEENTIYHYYDLATNKDPDVRYLRQETKTFSETGLKLSDVMLVLGKPDITDDSIITYYYLESDGVKWFIADVPLVETHTFYTNYEDVMG